LRSRRVLLFTGPVLLGGLPIVDLLRPQCLGLLAAQRLLPGRRQSLLSRREVLLPARRLPWLRLHARERPALLLRALRSDRLLLRRRRRRAVHERDPVLLEPGVHLDQHLLPA